MRNQLLITTAVLTLSACAYSGTFLEPPSAHTAAKDINADMRACMLEASTPRDLTATERQLIAGKETSRFFMEGRPVVNPDGKPALHQSAFPQSAKAAADLYAVCLLKRGYIWQTK